MHELSIALRIVNIAEEKVREAQGTLVEKIVLEIGELAGIESDALDFAWSEATRNSVLENSEFIVKRKKAMARCLNCNNEFKLTELYAACPSCNDFRKELMEGHQLKIKYLIII